MSKKLIGDIIAVGLVTAGVIHFGCRMYVKGVNSILGDIVENDFKVINADGAVMGFTLEQRTLFGDKVVAKL